MMIRRTQILPAILLTLLTASALFSQLVPPPRIEPAGPPLFVVTVKGKEGFMNQNGKVVIEPAFDKAYHFTDRLAGVSLGKEGWGFIDRTGKVVIPAEFAWVYGGFRHGIAEVAFDRKRAYLNKKGEWVWPPGE